MSFNTSSALTGYIFMGVRWGLGSKLTWKQKTFHIQKKIRALMLWTMLYLSSRVVTRLYLTFIQPDTAAEGYQELKTQRHSEGKGSFLGCILLLIALGLAPQSGAFCLSLSLVTLDSDRNSQGLLIWLLTPALYSAQSQSVRHGHRLECWILG